MSTHQQKILMTNKTKTAGRRYTGVAMILVMITVAIATLAAVSFMQSQRASTGIALNIHRHADAKLAAESIMDFAIEYIRKDASWRTNNSHGDWLVDLPMYQAVVNLRVEDETDTDLTNDKRDSIMITCSADIQGVTYSLRTRMSPYTPNWGNRMISRWKLDETDPTQGVRDSVSNNHGVYVNFDAARMNKDGPASDPSVSHMLGANEGVKAIYMNGGGFDVYDPPGASSSYLYIPDGPYKDLPRGSLTVWFKKDAPFDGGQIKRHEGIFSCMATGNGSEVGEMYALSWGKPLEILTMGCDEDNAQYNVSINDHDWHLLVMTWDDETFRVYFDMTQTWSWGFTCGLDNDEIMAFGICTRQMNTGDILPYAENKYFHGYMSDIKLYNYPIDKEDVGAIYNGVDQPPFEIFYDVR